MPEPKQKIIDGTTFEISQPYEEGHIITEIEARVLNQTRSENIGNNVRKTLKELKETAEAEGWGEKKLSNALTSAVAEADAEYEFTAAAARGAAKLDPVEKEARKKARALLKDHLAETGRKLTVPPAGETEESWAEKVEAQVDVIAANEAIIAAAREDVEARQARADKAKAALDDVSI